MLLFNQLCAGRVYFSYPVLAHAAVQPATSSGAAVTADSAATASAPQPQLTLSGLVSIFQPESPGQSNLKAPVIAFVQPAGTHFQLPDGTPFYFQVGPPLRTFWPFSAPDSFILRPQRAEICSFELMVNTSEFSVCAVIAWSDVGAGLLGTDLGS